jgi:sugar/nucleoside kinase (ribokinase family)
MNKRDTLVTELNVLGDFDPIIPEPYQNCDFLMLGNLAPSVQSTVIQRLKNRPKLILMDTMNFWMDIALEDLKKTISMVDIITVNDEEARQLTGEYHLSKAAKAIQKMGPKHVIIKKGEHGAFLFHQDGTFFAPALPLEEVFDPTGAGDTFAGGFIGYLANSGDLSFNNMKKALVYASAMASFCVEKFGTEKLVNLTQPEVDKRLKKFVELTHFEL